VRQQGKDIKLLNCTGKRNQITLRRSQETSAEPYAIFRYKNIYENIQD